MRVALRRCRASDGETSAGNLAVTFFGRQDFDPLLLNFVAGAESQEQHATKQCHHVFREARFIVQSPAKESLNLVPEIPRKHNVAHRTLLRSPDMMLQTEREYAKVASVKLKAPHTGRDLVTRMRMPKTTRKSKM